MKKSKGFTIQRKLYGGFGLVLFLLAVMSTISYVYLVKVNDSYTELIKHQSKTLQLIKDLNIAVESESSHLNKYLITGDPKQVDAFQQSQSRFAAALTQLKTLITDRDDKQILAGLDLLQGQFSSAAMQMIDAKKQDNTKAFVDISVAQGPVLDAFTTTANRFVERKQEALDVQASATFEEVERTKSLVILLTVVTLLAGAAATVTISRMISIPIIKLQAMASKIAHGDLRETNVVVKNSDEIGDLAKAFNLMAGNLRSLIQEVGTNAEQVAASSEQLTASAEQTGQATEHVAHITESLAEGTEKQVGTITESVSLVHKMDVEAKNIASRASLVTAAVQQASQVAAEGGTAVQSAIHQMSSVQSNVGEITQVVTSLGHRTDEIGQIIAIITDIAAQTNLLSLNAAIEAARAGESGKGFAVVAGEVRKLADQTARSGKQVSDVILAIQAETKRAIEKVIQGEKEVLEGIGAVHKAGESFRHIESSIHEVNGQIKEVSNSSAGMSLETKHLVAAFEEINRVTQEAAEGTHSVSASAQEQLASVEEITGSSRELARLAQKLQESIEKFSF
ncbi:methyl-accepting chemotaxis protein [Paenibacillus caseinilyticus]|uniref:Chemotaxis protein n=1 Tax=Paenibacillus mucilaginosus K02 TaxID=997761 RepID=I0BMJ9_9BACL|nr:methyl-accepting chemotaxis protein [Paenibacillus mucilaginosus]AFH63596.1 chemotaxis protein [Paenibacillus mucilaginosus K02]